MTVLANGGVVVIGPDVRAELADERVPFTDVVDLRTGEVVQIQGSVRVVHEPHREAIKAQVRRAVLLDPRWPCPASPVMAAKAKLEERKNAHYRALLERVAGQLAAKRRRG